MTDAELDEQHKAFTEAAKVIERARKSPKVLVPKPARA
jgi:hypothetical protein